MKYLFNLALLCLAISAAAQSNYQSGYVVKNNNEILHGFINSKDLQVTASYIEFKSSKESSTVTKFSPADIKSCYAFPNYYYLSYTGPLSNNKNSYPDIDEIKDTTTTYGSVFLQKAAGGPNVSLYTNSDEKKIRFFLKEKDSGPVELLYYEYGIPTGNTTKVSPFLSQLVEAFTKYNSANDKRISPLQRTEFNQASLEDAIAAINNNVKDINTTPSYTRFFAGASIESINTTFTNLLGTTISVKGTNVSPQISIGIDLLSNPDIQKFIFRMEFSFVQLKSSYTFSYSPNGLNTIPGNTFNPSENIFAFTPQIIYNIYNKENLKFFIGAGVSATYSMISNNIINYYSIQSFSPYTLKPETAPGFDPNPALGFGLPVQVGVVLNKRIELSANYSPPIGVTPGKTKGGSVNAKSQMIGGGVKYLF